MLVGAEKQPHDWRTRGSVGMNTSPGLVSPASMLTSSRTACLPSSFGGWLMVVSGGVRKRAFSMSSKPTTDTSSGTL